MGVYNILCLTGDGVEVGDHPEAKPVFDVDCMSMLEMIRGMRDESKFLSGRELSFAPLELLARLLELLVVLILFQFLAE